MTFLYIISASRNNKSSFTSEIEGMLANFSAACVSIVRVPRLPAVKEAHLHPAGSAVVAGKRERKREKKKKRERDRERREKSEDEKQERWDLVHGLGGGV